MVVGGSGEMGDRLSLPSFGKILKKIPGFLGKIKKKVPK